MRIPLVIFWAVLAAMAGYFAATRDGAVLVLAVGWTGGVVSLMLARDRDKKRRPHGHL